MGETEVLRTVEQTAEDGLVTDLMGWGWTMREMDELFEALGRSEFRRRFRLRDKEAAYLCEKGLDVVLGHARDFVEKRLSPAQIANDGRQTPLRNHAVFIAQHATATCCRGCLEKWHRIPKGRALSDREVQYVVAVIERWLARQRVD